MKNKIIEAIANPIRKLLGLIRIIVYLGSSFLYRLFQVKNCYFCPLCGYYGRFKTEKPVTGARKNALCAKCGSSERHRLQYLVINEIRKTIDTKEMSMLHFAPEYYFKTIFKPIFKTYITADLEALNVDVRQDLTQLSFKDNTFDFFYASHVLEHIKNDRLALSEIKRVLKPGGMAILPVPVIGKNTVEYGQEDRHEFGHVRCPGADYFDRYNEVFSKVRIYKSSDFDQKYQLYLYEDRTKWPDNITQRPFEAGEKHLDMVPVCVK